MGRLTLVLGGARSGKSAFAEGLVWDGEAEGKKVVYIATYEPVPGDEEMDGRLEKHRRRRPPSWRTVEEPRDLEGALSKVEKNTIVLVDCITVWVSNLLLAGDEKEAEEAILRRAKAFCSAARSSPADIVAVSGETGWGVVPPSSLGRLYRDILGIVNQETAKNADEVWLVIAGLPQRLK